jgi:hypothetical protein
MNEAVVLTLNILPGPAVIDCLEKSSSNFRIISKKRNLARALQKLYIKIKQTRISKFYSFLHI